MKINEIVNEGIGTGLLKAGAAISQYFDPALASRLEYALANAKPIDMSRDLNLQKFADIMANRAKSTKNQIPAQDIYKALPKVNYQTPDSRVSAVKSVIQDLQRRGINVIIKQKPVYQPTRKEQPYFLGGKQLNPNDPNDRAIIDKIKAQQGAV
jgi:hypothetical protein